MPSALADRAGSADRHHHRAHPDEFRVIEERDESVQLLWAELACAQNSVSHLGVGELPELRVWGSAAPHLHPTLRLDIHHPEGAYVGVQAPSVVDVSPSYC